MLEVFINFICSLFISIYCFFALKTIIKSKDKFLKKKTIFYIIITAIITTILNRPSFHASKTIFLFLLNTIICMKVFSISFDKALIAIGILMFLTNISDIAIITALSFVCNPKTIRTTWYIYVSTTIMTIGLSLLLLNIRIVKDKINKFYINISNNKSITTIIYFIFVIAGISLLCLNMYSPDNRGFFVVNLLILIAIFVITGLYIESKNKYNDLIDEYDNLFAYVQNFEEWIEKAQLNRHEYKNQLAVLRCLTKEKAVKDKIDEIIEDSINIEGPNANELKLLPKGGIKGLMYYKASIALKKKINLNISVSLNDKGIFSKLTEENTKIICKLIGIYFDNAIEAAAETRKKEVLIEIYELKDNVSIVFSNTFKKSKNFDERNNKGTTTKGEGHGNGLYFASKIIEKNNWIEEKQEVIDNYYIESIKIYKQKKEVKEQKKKSRISLKK